VRIGSLKIFEGRSGLEPELVGRAGWDFAHRLVENVQLPEHRPADSALVDQPFRAVAHREPHAFGGDVILEDDRPPPRDLHEDRIVVAALEAGGAKEMREPVAARVEVATTDRHA